jgi:hypothetical protein
MRLRPRNFYSRRILEVVLQRRAGADIDGGGPLPVVSCSDQLEHPAIDPNNQPSRQTAPIGLSHVAPVRSTTRVEGSVVDGRKCVALPVGFADGDWAGGVRSGRHAHPRGDRLPAARQAAGVGGADAGAGARPWAGGDPRCPPGDGGLVSGPACRGAVLVSGRGGAGARRGGRSLAAATARGRAGGGVDHLVVRGGVVRGAPGRGYRCRHRAVSERRR